MGPFQKLHVKANEDTDGRMAAIIGFVIGEEWTKPQIARIILTVDGWALAFTDTEQ